jgi:outer membrane receptor protein involved in Fe transport
MFFGKQACVWIQNGLFLAAANFAAMTALPAQTSADTTRLLQLHEVVVVGQQTSSEIIPVQKLSGKALQRLSAHSVADAIRYFSGVQLKDYGGVGGLKTVNIRSLGTNHVGVFYDGIALGNAQNGQVDLGRFSLDNMEAVALYNGQKSALLQPAKDFASANAVYLISRKPVFKDGETAHFILKYKTGSFDLLNPSAVWEHKWNAHLHSSVSVEQLYTSGKYKFRYAKKNGYDTTEVRQNGDVAMLRAEAALFGTLRDGEWQAKAYYYRSERGYPGAAVRETPGMFKHADRQWDDNFFVQGSLRKRFSNFYNLLLNGKYAYDYLHYLSDPRLDVTTMYVENQYRQQEAYLSSAHEFALFDFWNANLTCDFQFNTLDADLTDFVYPSRYMVLTAAATSLKWERFGFQASLLHTYVHDETEVANGSAGNKSAFTPTLAASYRPLPAEDWSFRAFYKRVFRLPTFNDLYYTFIGNKRLKPEYTTQYNIGTTYSRPFSNGWLKKLEVQLDAYYNEVEDKIVAMPTDNQFRWTMLNLGYVEIRGVEAAVHGWWQAGEVQLDTRLCYTYQQAQDFTDPLSEWYGGQIPYIPWHSGSVIAGGSYRGWRVNYSFIYTGERYEAVANIPENYAQPWYTHDLSLSWTFRLGKAQAGLSAEVNNLFDQQYEVVQCYPMPGRNFKLILKVEL